MIKCFRSSWYCSSSTTTIVACGASESVLNKSFSPSYEVDNYDNLGSFGVTYNEEKQTYDFVWSKLTIDLGTIIKPINDTVPVQKVIKDKNIEVKEDELVAIYSAEDQADLTINKESFISIKIKLNLYKGIKQATNEIKLIDQNVEYDVLLNLSAKPNLNSLTTPTVKSQKDIDEFKTMLIQELKKQKGFSKLDSQMVNIVKLDGTVLGVADLVENNTHVKLTLTDEGKKRFYWWKSWFNS